MATPLRFHLVNWKALPKFFYQGIESFPFETTQEAQMFSDLLVSRIRSSLRQAPGVNDSPELIGRFLASLQNELVRSLSVPGAI
jgi:hypothetical protein